MFIKQIFFDTQTQDIFAGFFVIISILREENQPSNKVMLTDEAMLSREKMGPFLYRSGIANS